MVKIQKQQNQEQKILKRVTNKRINNGIIQYFVKWKNMPEGTGDWLPAQSLAKCYKKVKEFQQNVWRYKKRQHIRRRLALIKTIEQKQQYDQKGLDITPLKQKVNQIQISSQSQISNSEQLLKDNNNIKGDLVKFQENIIWSKQKIQVARFDCISGQWKNCYYTQQQLEKINQLRNSYAQDYHLERVMIKKIIKANGNQIVQYEMGGQKFQCLLKSFQLFQPQLLLNYLLEFYNPTLHSLTNPNVQQISHCSYSDSQSEDGLPKLQANKMR